MDGHIIVHPTRQQLKRVPFRSIPKTRPESSNQRRSHTRRASDPLSNRTALAPPRHWMHSHSNRNTFHMDRRSTCLDAGRQEAHRRHGMAWHGKASAARPQWAAAGELRGGANIPAQSSCFTEDSANHITRTPRHLRYLREHGGCCSY